jgi:hypothetical protein
MFSKRISKMEDSILPDRTEVKGLIYYIRNTHNQKGYVGQTVSHRKNKGKYRPFGIEGRLRDHISEAICNTKKKQCNRLNSAIRHYGKEGFTVELLHTCPLNELDEWEQYYIQEKNTLYPEGYNLTLGGKTLQKVQHEQDTYQIQTPGKRGGCKERSGETRARISSQLKKTFDTPEVREYLMKRTQSQHFDQKRKRFEGVQLEKTNLQQYLHIRHSKTLGDFIRIKVEGRQTDFVGKHETLDALKERALEFLEQIAESATLSN